MMMTIVMIGPDDGENFGMLMKMWCICMMKINMIGWIMVMFEMVLVLQREVSLGNSTSQYIL